MINDLRRFFKGKPSRVKGIGVRKNNFLFDDPLRFPLSPFPFSRGFTLIELVVVIAVLAILASFMIAILDPFAQFQKARDSRRKSDLAQIQKALEQYYQDHQQYPQSSTNLYSPNYAILDTTTNPPTPVPWGGTTATWQKYIELMPKDPDTKRSYIYITGSSNQMYWLYAGLDRGAKDPDACPGGTCSNTQGITCGTVACNFGVSSPNTNP